LTLNSEEIKAVAIAIIELCLSEGSQSVENPVEQEILNFILWKDL